jgi:hypothetical protein
LFYLLQNNLGHGHAPKSPRRCRSAVEAVEPLKPHHSDVCAGPGERRSKGLQTYKPSRKYFSTYQASPSHPRPCTGHPRPCTNLYKPSPSAPPRPPASSSSQLSKVHVKWCVCIQVCIDLGCCCYSFVRMRPYSAIESDRPCCTLSGGAEGRVLRTDCTTLTDFRHQEGISTTPLGPLCWPTGPSTG